MKITVTAVSKATVPVVLTLSDEDIIGYINSSTADRKSLPDLDESGIMSLLREVMRSKLQRGDKPESSFPEDAKISLDPEQLAHIKGLYAATRDFESNQSPWLSMTREAHCGTCHEIQFAALHTLADIHAEHPEYFENTVLEDLAGLTSGMNIQEFAEKLMAIAESLEGKPDMDKKVLELRNKAIVLMEIENKLDDGDMKLVDPPKPESGVAASAWLVERHAACEHGRLDSSQWWVCLPSKDQSMGGIHFPFGSESDAKQFFDLFFRLAPQARIISPEEIKEEQSKGQEQAVPPNFSEPVLASHGYSSVMVLLPDNMAGLIKAYAAAIPDDAIHTDEDGSKGREGGPHITVKYGLHTQDAEDVRAILSKFGPVRARLGDVTVFEQPDKPYDVVKFDVDSEDLIRLNKALSNLPHTDTHPEYHPHATVAYVKKGLGAKYAKEGYWGKKVCPEHVFEKAMFSPKEGDVVHIPLSRESTASKFAGLVPASVVRFISAEKKTSSSKLYIGTSGFKYKHWAGEFYPQGVSRRSWLSYYAERFPTVEISSTFHNFPEARVIKAWCSQTPADFLFCLRGPREVTHVRHLEQSASVMSAFMRRAELFGNKLGAVTFQLQESEPYDGDKLRAFVDSLPKGFKYAMEFRSEPWYNEECYDILRSRDIANVIVGHSHMGVHTVPTASWSYVRMSGNNPDFSKNSYTDEQLMNWRGIIADCPRPSFVYFNNEYRAYAAHNAAKMMEIMGVKVRPAPSKTDNDVATPPPQSINPNYFGVPVDQRSTGPENQVEDPLRQREKPFYPPDPWMYLEQYPEDSPSGKATPY